MARPITYLVSLLRQQLDDQSAKMDMILDSLLYLETFFYNGLCSACYLHFCSDYYTLYVCGGFNVFANSISVGYSVREYLSM